VRSFLCSRSARPKKGLARRPQSKASHTLTWLSDEEGESERLRAQLRIGSTALTIFRGALASARWGKVQKSIR
jgi:hypothetical protein